MSEDIGDDVGTGIGGGTSDSESRGGAATETESRGPARVERGTDPGRGKGGTD